MNRRDRSLAILVLLQGGTTLAANDLARRFAVSQRTIYRDVDVLIASGVPVQSEMGRKGGFRLQPDALLPPVMFSEAEATALAAGLIFLNRLRNAPLQSDLDAVHQKVVATLPDHLQHQLAEKSQQINNEALPFDRLYAGVSGVAAVSDQTSGGASPEAQIVAFIRALTARHHVFIKYRLAEQPFPQSFRVQPCGIFWEHTEWYLVGYLVGTKETKPRFWRVSLVETITPCTV
jgi:predicted DNA-binding transcriptional regulator YafY